MAPNSGQETALAPPDRFTDVVLESNRGPLWQVEAIKQPETKVHTNEKSTSENVKNI